MPMAASCLRSSLSFPSSAAEDSPTPPAKRFAPHGAHVSRSISSAGTDRVGEEHFRYYDLALRVYSAVRDGKLAEGVSFPDATTKRRIYRLVFDVLYHQEVIEELLIESGFYSRNCDLHGKESLVQLMVFDYQDRNFSLKLPRGGSKNIPRHVVSVAEALIRHRVRLNAALARLRVKSNAQSTSRLMPEASYLKYQAVINEPFYVRINAKRVHNFHAEIASQLCNDGFTMCSSKKELTSAEKSFYRLHRHLLAFSPNKREAILQHQLLTEGYLVQQDSASYFFIEGMRELLVQCCGSVVVTHCNAGVEVAHIASMLTEGVSVIVYGVLPMHTDVLQTALHSQHIDNVEFIHAPFYHADASSEDLADVSAIICLPPSSLATVTQPLDFIQQDGDHFASLLLSRKRRLTGTWSREQGSTLIQALTFSQCQHIVYAVRSQDKQETSDIVTGCLEKHRTTLKEDGRDFIHTSNGVDIDLTGTGYHVTLLERKPEDPKPTASEIIAKAITSGVLSGDGLDMSSTTQLTHTVKKKRKKAPRIFSQHKGIPMTISAQNKVTPKKILSTDANSQRPFR